MGFLSPALQPPVLVALEIAVTASMLGLTSSKSRFFRVSGWISVITVAYLTILATRSHVSNTMWAGVLAGNASTYVLRYLDLVILDQWSFDSKGPITKTHVLRKSKKANMDERSPKTEFSQQSGTLWQRFKFGLDVNLSSRQLNTPCQVKNVPVWSSRNPEYIPSRREFLWSTAISVSVSYAIVDLCSLGTQPERNATIFSSDHIGFFSRLGKLDVEDGVRVIASLVVWLNIFCIFRIFHGSWGFLSVSFGTSAVKDWAPPFGPLSEAYSVRRFWGVFWHQMFRQTFGGPARFVVHDILRLSQNTLVARYSKIFVTFFISGLLHLSTDIVIGIGWEESGAIRFFCTQAIGILLEDSIQALHRGLGLNSPESPRGQQLVHLIGYIWVGCFLSWSTPVWAYPAMRRNQGTAKDKVLPLSVMQYLFL